MRGTMLSYNITDEKILTDVKEYLSKYQKARKEQVFKYLVGKYGAMDRDDFNFAWKNK